MKEKWTKEELEAHIRVNMKDPYSASVVAGALFKKIYGEYPKIGLSGAQAGGIDFLVDVMPETKED